MKIKAVLLYTFICFSSQLSAQTDLLSLLDSAKAPEKSEKVIATFKTTKIISAQSTETVKKGTMDFRVTHRFGSTGTGSGGGVHTLYGFDQSEDIRISFDFGITEDLMIGIGRSKQHELIDGLVKYRFLTQTTDNKIPVSVAFYGDMSVNAQDKDNLYLGTVGVENKFLHRIAYTSQLIIARKFGSKFSLELLPTYQYRNFIIGAINPTNKAEDDNGIPAIGIGGRVKITKRMAIVADYFYIFSDFRKDNVQQKFFNPLALGIEIETGGHVFHLNFTNASGIIENNFIPDTHDDWLKGGSKFGFNISRVFTLGGKKKKSWQE